MWIYPWFVFSLMCFPWAEAMTGKVVCEPCSGIQRPTPTCTTEWFSDLSVRIGNTGKQTKNNSTSKESDHPGTLIKLSNPEPTLEILSWYGMEPENLHFWQGGGVKSGGLLKLMLHLV